MFNKVIVLLAIILLIKGIFYYLIIKSLKTQLSKIIFIIY